MGVAGPQSAQENTSYTSYAHIAKKRREEANQLITPLFILFVYLICF